MFDRPAILHSYQYLKECLRQSGRDQQYRNDGERYPYVAEVRNRLAKSLDILLGSNDRIASM